MEILDSLVEPIIVDPTEAVSASQEKTKASITQGLMDDPFDPARLRLSQDFASNIGVKKALITVPDRKPDKQWFIRVHPSPEWRLDTILLELKEENEIYLVDPSIRT